jgi:hypothetical protein
MAFLRWEHRSLTGATAERYENVARGLSLRNPWIDSIDESLSLNATRGFEDSTPGYDL